MGSNAYYSGRKKGDTSFEMQATFLKTSSVFPFYYTAYFQSSFKVSKTEFFSFKSKSIRNHEGLLEPFIAQLMIP